METALAKGFGSNMGDTKYPCVCRRTKLPRRGVHRKVRETGDESEKKLWQIVAVCSLFWLGSVTSEELAEEFARDHAFKTSFVAEF